ncbi:MAG: glycosyltransferase family 39 protein [bacterium]
MRKGSSKYISRLLKYLLFIGAVSYIIVFIFIAFYRIGYPFELEWLEGGSLDQVKRILAGYKLYVKPSLKFVPFIYPPFYFYLSAGLSKLIGIGFMPLRLVSLIASLVSFVIIFLIVRQETKDAFAGFVASCLFAATFRICGAWFDIARVDALFLVFLLAALYVIKFKSSLKSSLLAGVLVALSFLTKQTALIISLPLLLYHILMERRRSILFIGTLALIIGTSTWFLNYIHGGWYNYYIFNLPGQHSIVKSEIFNFWSLDIVPVSIAFIISLFYLFAQSISQTKKNFLFYSSSAVGMIGGAFLSKLHSGAYSNVLLPAYAIISILFGLGVHTAFQFIRTAPANKQSIMEIYVYLVCIVQFVCLAYNPYVQVPTRKDLDAGMKFVSYVSEIKGDVFIPSHPYLTALANKSSHAHVMAMIDVIRGDKGKTKAELAGELRDVLREKRFSSILLDSRGDWFQEDIDCYYRATQRPLFNIEPELFRPVTGWNGRPTLIYIPRD